jgi:hypothetical protein
MRPEFAMQPEPISLVLTNDEALVLLDFLTRFVETDELTTEDRAEQQALWNLQCLLEKQMAEVFDPAYRELVQQARARLRDPS